jgi:nicotinamidase-related amidase
MTTQLTIDPKTTAMLSMDCQTALVSIYAKDPDFVARAAGLLSQARAAGMTVIHVQVGFRPNLPEISARNRFFSSLKNSPQHRQIFEGAAGAIHPALSPQADDITVVKHRVSAFAGTDLEMVLRAKDIDTLVLFGIATSGVVLSTLLEGGDRDYRVIVASDCCADLDAEGHAWLLDKFFPRRAEVAQVGEIIEALKTKAHQETSGA